MARPSTQEVNMTNNHTLDVLTQRLEHLERDVRLWRIAGCIGLAILAFLTLSAAAQQQVANEIVAKRFVAVGPSGKRQAELSVDHSGQPGLAIFDTAGQVRARLMLAGGSTAVTESPSLLLFDKSSKLRAVMALNPEGMPRLALRDENGTVRAVLGHTSIQSEGSGGLLRDEARPASSLILLDKGGAIIWNAP
jgi:hypothetical protein